MSVSEKLFLCPVLLIQEDFIIQMLNNKWKIGIWRCETRQNVVKMYGYGIVFFIPYLQFTDF